MLATESNELREIAAGLVARGGEKFALREERLLRGLARHPDDPGIQMALLDLYGPARLEDLVARYGADTSVSVSFRVFAIDKLGSLASPDRSLSSEAAGALEQAAWNSSDYGLVRVIALTLKAWRLDLPWVIQVKSRENQSRALFAVSVLCVILDLAAFFVGLVALLLIRSDGRVRSAPRAVMVLGWLALSAGMSFLIVWGAIGFLGHNSAPLPIASLTLNAPLYVATPVYLILATILFRRMRRSRLA